MAAIRKGLARLGALIPAVLIMSAALSVSDKGAAAISFDGAWSVEIVTEKGDCDRVYRYPVAIQDNQVRFRSIYGETSNYVAGTVGFDGRVLGTIGQGDEQVSVAGKLTRESGSGRWHAPGRGCSGRWRAEKRG